MRIIIEYTRDEINILDSIVQNIPESVLVEKKKKYETRRDYYLDNIEKRRMYQREKYANTHERKYARYYQITTPKGEVIRKDNMKEVEEYFGYSERTIKRRMKNNDLFGFKITKIII